MSSKKQSPVGVDCLELMFYNIDYCYPFTFKEEIDMSKRNIVHVEFPAANVEATGRFYQELFGWKLQHFAEMNYTMWESEGGSSGGFPQVSEDNPTGQVLVHIHSDDIEADLKKVEELGGKVLHPKTEIPQTGWFGIFQDLTGNILALYTSMDEEYNKNH